MRCAAAALTIAACAGPPGVPGESAVGVPNVSLVGETCVDRRAVATGMWTYEFTLGGQNDGGAGLYRVVATAKQFFGGPSVTTVLGPYEIAAGGTDSVDETFIGNFASSHVDVVVESSRPTGAAYSPTSTASIDVPVPSGGIEGGESKGCSP